MKSIKFSEVKLIRDIVGITQKDFAKHLGVTRQLLSKVEKENILSEHISYRLYIELNNIVLNSEHYNSDESKIRFLQEIKANLLKEINNQRESLGLLIIT